MPIEIKAAIDWALTQNGTEGEIITKENHRALVDKVREYFNTNGIAYSTFSYVELMPFFS